MKPVMYPLSGFQQGHLVIMGRPRGGEWLDDEMVGLRQAHINIVVSLLEPYEISECDLIRESDTCTVHGIEYRSLPIRDRDVPKSYHAVKELVSYLYGQLCAGRGVAIHCRAGIGRSGLLAACLFVHGDVTPEQAFASIAQDRRCSVPDTAEQEHWVRTYFEWYQERDTMAQLNW